MLSFCHEKITLLFIVILVSLTPSTAKKNEAEHRVRERGPNIVFTNALLRVAVDDFLHNPAHAILKYGPINSWDTSHVTDMNHLFSTSRNRAAARFNEYIGDWNTAKVSTMTKTFEGAELFNTHLRNWQVHNVYRMNSMFLGASNMDKPIGNWNVERVKDMESMFRNARSFNRNLLIWNVANVKSMRSMFDGASTFNRPLNKWVVENVVDMSSMFNGATMFNQDLDHWRPLSVTDTSGMFASTSRFNSPIGGWTMNNVRDMSKMFQDAASFNSPLTGWDTARCERMDSMFERAVFYNQPMGSWQMSSVTSTMNMFSSALRFNQPLNDWNMVNVIDTSDMFANAKSFNRPLDNWVLTDLFDMDRMFSKASSFSQNLCSWGTRISQRVSAQHVFSGSACPSEEDPDFQVAFPGPLCYFCDPFSTLPPTTTTSGPNPGPDPQSLYTADDIKFSYGTTFTYDLKGTSGTRAAILNGPGSAVEWKVTVGKSETRRLVFRYGNGGNDIRVAKVSVAGVHKGDVKLRPTGGFDIWSTDDDFVTYLRQGTYGIRLECLGEGFSLDFMIISH